MNILCIICFGECLYHTLGIDPGQCLVQRTTRGSYKLLEAILIPCRRESLLRHFKMSPYCLDWLWNRNDNPWLDSNSSVPSVMARLQARSYYFMSIQNALCCAIIMSLTAGLSWGSCALILGRTYANAGSHALTNLPQGLPGPVDECATHVAASNAQCSADDRLHRLLELSDSRPCLIEKQATIEVHEKFSSQFVDIYLPRLGI